MATLVGHGATVGITVVQAFVLIPLCLSALGAQLYGAWVAASELLNWIQLLDIGIPYLLTQRVGAALGRGDRADAARWSATGLMLLSGVAVCLWAVATAGAPFAAIWVRAPSDQTGVFTGAFRLAAAASALILIFSGVLGLSRGAQKPRIPNGAQVLGVAAGLAISVGLLASGWGLWALPMGMAARAIISLAGGAIFLARLPGRRLWLLGASRERVRETQELEPAIAGACFGLLLVYSTEVLIVAAMLGPVPALVYSLTRRAAEGLRNLLDVFVTAVHGGFAHLVTAHDRARAREVMHEIVWLRTAAACLCGAVLLLVNQGFVTRLFGAQNFGGLWLTSAFVVQMIIGGHSLLFNALLRAAGHIREGSWLLLAEALVRVAAISVALYALGLAGAPWAAATVNACALVITRRQLERALPASAGDAPPPPLGSRIAPLAVLGVAAVASLFWTPLSWRDLVATGLVAVLAGGAFLWWMRPAGFGRGVQLS
jgi:O-antigen/teichoic acid export membrane protein